MMSSWYQNQDNNDDDESGSPNDNLIIDYKLQYQQLKKKLKFLIYENEFFQDNLKTSQRRLLKVTRDKSYLLDRLITYEYSSTESEFSDSSDDETADSSNKRRKVDSGVVMTGKNIIMPNQRMPKKRPIIKKHPNIHSNVTLQMNHHQQHNPGTVESDEVPLEEVARHLQLRPSSFLELAVPGAHTVPQEMFSNEPSLDSESNE